MARAASLHWHDAALAGQARRRTCLAMKKSQPLATGLTLALLALVVHAQTPGTQSIGTAKGGGKLLTREQLRTCLAQQKDLGTRRPAVEAERSGLERERKELDELQQSLDAEREAIDKLSKTASDLVRRTQELSAQTADFNERVQKFQNAGLTGPTAERQQRTLERDKAALDKAAAELDKERADIGPRADRMSQGYSAHVAARNQAATDWNARNAKLTQVTQAYETDLQNWKIDCEGRSYREDDEKAILSGK
jgi:septal ring factor EnvC (AmiA/AmiB activator)